MIRRITTSTIAALVLTGSGWSFADQPSQPAAPATPPAATAPQQPAETTQQAEARPAEAQRPEAQQSEAESSPPASPAQEGAAEAQAPAASPQSAPPAQEQTPAPAPASPPAPAAESSQPAAPAPADTSEQAPAAPAASPETAPAPAPTPPAAEPASEPAAESEDDARPVAADAQAVPPPPEMTFRFQFEGMPYAEVVRRFARAADKPLLGEVNIEGQMTFIDNEPYTYPEALDTLNIFLGMRGFQLMETGRYLRLANVGELGNLPKPILRGELPIDGLRPGQLVTMVLPLQYMESAEAARTVLPMVSTIGNVAPLARGRAIVITDTVASIGRIRQMLALIDQDAMADQQIRTIRMRHASARAVAEIVGRTLGQPIVIGPSPGRGRPAPTAPAVFATFDERANTLILRGNAETVALAEQLVAQLDQPQQEDLSGTLRVFELKNARSDDITAVVNQLFPSGRGQPAGPRVVSDQATNRVIASGTLDQIATIERVVAQMDEAAEVAAGTKVLRLQHAQADQLARMVTAAISRRDARGRPVASVNIVADSATNTLVLTGPSADVEQALTLIGQLDDQQLQEAREVRVVPVLAGDVNALARSLRSVLTRPPAPGQRGGILNATIEPDAATSTLIIAAPPAEWPGIEKILADLGDAIPEGLARAWEAPVSKVLELKHAQADEVAPVLVNIFANPRNPRVPRGRQPTTPVVITAQPRSNSILISASPSDQEEIAAVVAMLDTESAAGGDSTELVRLDNAMALEVANAVRATLPPTPRGQQASVVIQPDERSNTILLRGSADDRERVKELITALDRTTETAAAMRVYRVQHAQADQLGRMISSSLTRRDARGRVTPTVNLVADGSTNTLVLTGSASDVDQAIRLLEQLDNQQLQESREVRVVPVPGADVNALARSLRSVLSRPAAPGQRGPTLSATIEPDVASSSLIIAAAPAEWTSIEKVLGELTDAIPENLARGWQQPVSRIVPLKHAQADELAPVLVSIFADPRNPRVPRGRTPVAPTVITAQSRTNSLLISAPPSEQDEIAQLIAVLDTEADSERVATVLVQLENAAAAEVANALRATLPPVPRGQQPSVVIQPDNRSNTILLRGPIEERNQLQELIASLDQNTQRSSGELRTVALRHASAEPVAATLTQVFANPRAPRTARGDPRASATPVVISANPRNNTVVISASSEDQQAIAEVIASLDVPAENELDGVVIVQLEAAQAEEVAQAIRATLPPTPRGQSPEIAVQAEARSNTLLVRAPADQRQRIEELIGRLDQTTRDTARETRLIRLQHASANALAQMLTGLYAGQTQPARGRGPQQAASPRGVTIAAAPGDSTLLVEAPRVMMEEIAQLVSSLDIEGGAGQVLVRSYAIGEANAAQLARSMNNLFALPRGQQPRPGEVQPRFEADAATNQLIVAAAADQFPRIEETINTIESVRATESQTRTFSLRFAKAEETAPILAQMLDAQMTGQAAPRGRQPAGAGNEQPARVAALPQSNSLIVQGSASALTLAESILATIDTPEAVDTMTIQVVQLTNAQAPSLAEAVNALLAARGGAQARPARPGQPAPAGQVVTVTAEPNSNSLMVRGPLVEVPDVINMIRRLDQQSSSSMVELRTFALRNSDAREMSTNLGRLFNDIIRQRTQANRNLTPPPFAISADARTNSLVVSTTAPNFALVKQLIDELDASPDLPSQEVRFFSLANADPFDVAFKLNGLFATRRAGERPQIEADSFTNSITVIGRTEDFAQIEPVLRQLDEAAVHSSRQVRVIKMDRVRADRMGELLQRIYPQVEGAELILTQDPTPPPAQEPGGIFRSLHADEARGAAEGDAPTSSPQAPAGGADSEAGDPAGGSSEPASQAAPARTDAERAANANDAVNIAVDRTANALIVAANRRQIETIERLIRDLSSGESAAESDFQIFRVRHADPNTVVRTLTSLFNVRTQVAERQAAEERQQQRGQQQRERVPVPPPAITAVAEPRTQSVIVRAKPADMEMVAQLIAEIDRVPTVTSEVRVFKLKNAAADDVSRNLRELFANASVTATPGEAAGRQGRGGPAQQRVEEVGQLLDLQAVGRGEAASSIRISGNRTTNSVVVAAPAEIMGAIADIIAELDQSGGQASETIVRLFPLRHAEVSPTVSSLRELLVSSRPRNAQIPAPVITGDESGRQILASGTDEQLAQIADLIRQLDESQEGDPVLVRVYRIQNTDAQSVANAVSQTLARSGAPAPRRGAAPTGAEGPRVTAERGGNSIVVRATAAEHEAIAELIAELDTAPMQDEPVRIIALRSSEADQVANILRRVFVTGGGRTARTPGAAAISIEADRNSNLLLVRADEATTEKIRALAMQLDVGSAGGRPEQTILALQHAQAASVAPALTQAFAPPRGTQISPENQVTIIAEPTSNSLIVTANEANLERVRQLLARLDTESAEGTRTEFLVLQNAQAQEMARTLTRIAANMAPQAARGQQARRVIVEAETSSNAIVFSGPGNDIDRLVRMAVELDQSGPATESGVFILSLRRGDASQAAGMVREIYNQQATLARQNRRPIDPLSVTADPRANALVLATTESMYEQVRKWITDIEALEEQVTEPRVIVLEHADPREVQAALQAAFAAPGMAAQPARRGAQPAATGGRIEISVLEQQRSLVVRSTEEDFQGVRALATILDEAAKAKRPTPRIYPMRFAQAAVVAPALSQSLAAPRGVRQAAEDQITIVAETNANAILVTASTAGIERVEALLQQLDVQTDAGMKTEYLVLRNTQAADLARTLTRVAANTATPAVRGQQVQRVVVEADPSSNTLVMSGPAAELDRILTMARQIDEGSEERGSSVFLISLKKSDAVRTAQMVRDLYNQQAAVARQTRRNIDPLAVTADSRANALVLSTTEAMFAQVQDWVGQVEEMTRPVGTPRLIILNNAEPSEVQRAVQDLFGAQGAAAPDRASDSDAGGQGAEGARGQAPRGGAQGAGGAGGRVDVSVLAQQRALVVNADDEDYETIMRLVELLDRSAEEKRSILRVFQITNASNARIADALNTMYRAQPQRTGEERINVTALPQSNAVVVSAPERRMQEVADLIQQLDSPQTSQGVAFKIYTLEHGRPTQVLGTLNQLLAPLRQARPGEPITAQADDRTRSIIITAQGTVFEQIDRIIATLDQPAATGATDVLIIPLKHADATRLAEVLQAMLRPSAGQVVTPEALALQEQIRRLRVHLRQADPEAELPELDLTKPIRINADPVQAGQQGSNRLIVTSTPENLRAMSMIVEMLDDAPLAAGVTVKIIPLRHADADVVRNTLREIFTQGRAFAGRPRTAVEGRAEPEEEDGRALVYPLNVSSELRTNSVVISGQAASVELAESIVKDLDRDQPRMVTEVRLFQLKHADVNRLLPVLRAVFAEGAEVPGLEGVRTQVTRLRSVINDEQVNMTDTARVRAALTIQGDPSSQIIAVAARRDMMPLIADVIQAMDIPGSAAGVYIITLEHADASRLKPVIDALYTGPSASLLRPEDRPTVSVDTRTNALVVASSGRTFEVLSAMIRRLDIKQAIDVRDIRILPLKNGEAGVMAATIQQIMDNRVQRQANLGAGDAEALRVFVTPDPRTNSLLIAGSGESFELIESLVTQLDGAAPGLLGQVQLFPLQHANAGPLAASMTTLFNQRYAAATAPEIQRQRPIILADLRTNSLLVVANQDDTEVFRGLLARLDVELTDPAVMLTVIPMQHNDAGIVGQTIQQIFQARLAAMTPQGQPVNPQDRVDVASDALANALVISASRENLALIRGLLEKVDVPPPSETGIVRIYPLRNTDVSRMATMLQSLISQGLYKPGRAAATSPALQAQERVAITTDIRTNSLIISASRENVAVIEEIITRLDGAEAISLVSDLRVFTLERADATRVAPTLQQLFNAKRQAEVEAGDSGRSLAVTFVADPRTNSLMVAGSRESFAAVETLLASLDREGAARNATFQVFSLEQSTAAVIAPMVQQLFDRRPIRPGEERQPVTVIPDPRTNLLLIGGTPEDMELAASIIQRMDEASGTTQPMRIFPLQRADANQVANSLRALVAGQGAAAAAGIGISVDERTNALIVTAGQTDLARLQELVEKLDIESVLKVTEIRIFPLSNARATEVAPILLEALTNKPTALHGQSPNRQTLLRFIERSEDGQKLSESALQENLLITPDRRSNSLVVSAPIESMPLLERLIRALDAGHPRRADLQVFHLRNADAAQMGELISDMFRLQQANQDGNRSIQYTLVEPLDEDGNGGPGVSAILGTDDQAALTVTVDMRTNSLIVGGTREYIELAGRVIKQLDESPAQERVTRIYYPRFTQAAAIETALRSFLDQERQRLTQTLGTDAMGAAIRRLEMEVAVVAEQNTNSLLVSASPRNIDAILQMIKDLDREQPQVLIQVMLAEVSLDDRKNLGFDWNLTQMVDGSTVTVGTDFGIQNAITQLGGFNVSVTGGDANFFLQALQREGRVQVLSRPQITAADNQPARITVGQQVPLITASRVTEQNDTINTISYEDVSISLEVTPRINPDGLVTLSVSPSVRSLSTSSVEISRGVSAPIINNRQAETTVSVQDGQTILIGGLITTSDDRQESKVPILGDIPILGYAFRKTEILKERRELLIILTPFVVRNQAEVNRVTNLHTERTGLIKDMTRDELQEQIFEPFRARVNGELPNDDDAWPPVRSRNNGVRPVPPAREEPAEQGQSMGPGRSEQVAGSLQQTDESSPNGRRVSPRLELPD